jgi:hypothetical protein
MTAMTGEPTVPTPTVLVATWRDGLFVMSGDTPARELDGQSVRGLAPDGQGGALAIVDQHSLRRRAADGVSTPAASLRVARLSRSSIRGATFASRPTPAAAGSAKPAASRLRAASSSCEKTGSH